MENFLIFRVIFRDINRKVLNMRITESVLRKIIRQVLLEKKFSDLKGYAKNKEMNIYDDILDPENEELRDEVFALIDNSYKYLGGHGVFSNEDDLLDSSKNDYHEFLAYDIDEDPQPDVIRAMKTKSGKKKFGLSATDGSEKAGVFVKADTIRRLKDGNHFAELSGRSASLAMKSGVSAYISEEEVNNLLKKDVKWFGEHPYFSDPEKYGENWHEGSLEIEAKKSKQYGANGKYDGWYERKLGGGKTIVKMLFGK